MYRNNTLFSSIFSDGTSLFRQPAEPDPGDAVAVRLRLQKGDDALALIHKMFEKYLEIDQKKA